MVWLIFIIAVSVSVETWERMPITNRGWEIKWRLNQTARVVMTAEAVEILGWFYIRELTQRI